MKIYILVDISGWIGVVALLAAYALVSTKKLEGDAVVYQLLNVAGAALLIVNSFYYGAVPSVGVNIVWIGIGMAAIIRKKSRTVKTDGPSPD